MYTPSFLVFLRDPGPESQPQGVCSDWFKRTRPLTWDWWPVATRGHNVFDSWQVSRQDLRTLKQTLSTHHGPCGSRLLPCNETPPNFAALNEN